MISRICFKTLACCLILVQSWASADANGWRKEHCQRCESGDDDSGQKAAVANLLVSQPSCSPVPAKNLSFITDERPGWIALKKQKNSLVSVAYHHQNR